ncbi:MAG: hypothetical protein U0793_26425 [Gemmataceae bacterium]
MSDNRRTLGANVSILCYLLLFLAVMSPLAYRLHQALVPFPVAAAPEHVSRDEGDGSPETGFLFKATLQAGPVESGDEAAEVAPD